VSNASLTVDPTADISPDARIFPSSRGTKITIGARTRLDVFTVIRCVGGSGDVNIGQDCYVNPGCVLYSGNGIELGNNVLLAPGVQLMATNHNWDRRDVPIRLQGFRPSKGGIVIEDDVWIGANSTVLDGARIGRGAIIAACSLVSGEVPPYEIWGGVPLRKISERP
jgi:virginiamycin A acetyltransferase